MERVELESEMEVEEEVLVLLLVLVVVRDWEAEVLDIFYDYDSYDAYDYLLAWLFDCLSSFLFFLWEARRTVRDVRV